MVYHTLELAIQHSTAAVKFQLTHIQTAAEPEKIFSGGKNNTLKIFYLLFF